MTTLTPLTDSFADLADLADALSGELTLPAAADWDAARTAWNLAVDQRPAAVVRAASVRDIVATVDAARRLGLRVAPQGTGHNAAPLGDLADTILLRTSQMRTVHIDPVHRIARVEAGALWADVCPAAAEYGLAALAGSSADVGVVGYTLGGGLSWLARSHGLAANHVTAIEVVTADGRHRRASDVHDTELFWALRGGGGGFGVVTALEFELFPLREVIAGALFWPIDDAQPVLRAWREWVEELPDTVTSVSRVLRLPPLPEIPEPLRGRAFVVIEAAMQLDAARADALLAALRALAPEIDTFAVTPVERLHELHMDPTEPVPCLGDGALLRSLPPDALDALLESVGADSGSALLSAEVRHLGGELTPGRTAGGATSGLAGEFLLFGVGITPSPEAAAAVRASVDRMLTCVETWRAETAYLNFVESPAEPGRLFGDSLDRLRRIKADVDPTDLMRSNHPVGP
ncbi:FAD-binding protein [Microbacterium sp. BWT-B31]|uniref:FAD-dependent oxidoreductase n=1 Tax=Microbacterium sp. BWT-B31 TaxID=3232072 RepID=UPI00352713D0